MDIHDDLLVRAKKRAAETHQTLTAFVEDALRMFFENQRRAKTAKPFKMRTVKGKLIPDLDINNTRALLDFLDEEEYVSARREHPDQRTPDKPAKAS
ncbi:MAG TPA: hypothetical protein VJ873_10945 [bacterium]|nr:hypothetical protein [bacterium]